MKIIYALAILDTNTDRFISEGYKDTKKNEKLMREEIERLNKEYPYRYRLGGALVGSPAIRNIFDDSNPNTY